MSLREQVYELDEGRCVACKMKQRRHGGTWAWHVHHCVPAQWLRRERLLRLEPDVCVLLCRRCHERHESRMGVVFRELLPHRVILAAEGAGTAAEDKLLRCHPELVKEDAR